MFENTPLTLIDFGFATKYLHTVADEHGNKKVVHKPKQRVGVFRGNMIFSSINQLQFVATSCRDDLISLCYLLVYLITEGRLPNIDIYGQGDMNERFQQIRDAKLKYKLEDLCNEESGTADLADFFQECFSCRRKEKPKYGKLRAILEGLIEFEDDSEIDEEEKKVPSGESDIVK